MSVNIGDAVLTFVGDTTQLDVAFNSVGAKAEAGLKPANDALDEMQEGFDKTGEAGSEAATTIEDAGRRTSRSMRQATGETALLGELFGIRLPRHVRSFVAELPGVGVALNAAFSATAILFIIQALIQAEEKLRAFLSHDKEHEEQARLLDLQNRAIEELGKEAAKSAEELDKLTHTPVELMTAKIKLLTTEYDNLYRATYASEAVLSAKGKALENEIALLQKQLELEKQKEAAEANGKTLANLTKEIELRKNLGNVQVMYDEAVRGLGKENADEMRYRISIKALQAQAKAEAEYGKDSVEKVKAINAEIEKAQTEHTLKMTEELAKEKSAYEKTLDDLGKSLVEHNEELVVANTVQENSMHQLAKAASDLGITLQSDLVLAYQKAVAAQKELLASGIATQLEIKDGAKAVQAASDAMNHMDSTLKNTESELGKQGQLWKLFKTDVVQAGNQMKFFTDIGREEFQQFTNAAGAAFIQFANHEASFGQAMEKMAKSTIDSLAEQAIGQALYWTAMGIADTFFNPPAAAAAFGAAEMFAAVAALSGGAALAMGGIGGNGSGSTPNNNQYQNNNSGSNTNSQAQSGRSQVGVQAFADGGLVSGPTLALIGEAGREAAMPLDNPDAMDTIGRAVASALAKQGGGGTHFHVNVKGLISDGELSKVMQKMSKRVTRGQGYLKSSDTFKITRRGA